MITGLLGSLSGGFRPLDIAGCILWLDAPQIVGLSDGNAVGTWTDLSGQGNSGTQGTESAKPTYKVNIQASKPVVRFDGGDDLLGTISITTETVGVIAVVKFDADTINSGRIFTLGAAADADWNQPGAAAVILRDGVGDALGGYRNSVEMCSQSAGADVFNVVSSIFDGTVHTMYVNGVAGTPVSSTGAFAVTRFGLGSNQSGGEQFKGDIAELLLYASGLTTNSRQQVERYLAQKWGITIDQSPVNTVAPALTAAGWTVGQVASCDTGTWTNSPTTYAYQWQRKDGGYTNIPGATNDTYLLQAGDAGKNVRCGVTPSNAFATGSVAYSLDSDLIL